MDIVKEYSNPALLSFDNQVEKLQKEHANLQALSNHLENDIKNLTNKIIEMKKIQDSLARQISELFRTTKVELERKDRTIAELKEKLKQFVCKKSTVMSERPSSKQIKRSANDVNKSSYKRIKIENHDFDEIKRRRRSGSHSRDYCNNRCSDRRDDKRSRGLDNYKNRHLIDEDNKRKSLRDSQVKQRFEAINGTGRLDNKERNFGYNNCNTKLRLETKENCKKSTKDSNKYNQRSNKLDNNSLIKSEKCTQNKQKVIILENKVIQKAKTDDTSNNKISDKNPSSTIKETTKESTKNSETNLENSQIKKKKTRRRSDETISKINIINGKDTEQEDKGRVLRSMVKRPSSKSEIPSKKEDENEKEAAKDSNKQVKPNLELSPKRRKSPRKLRKSLDLDDGVISSNSNTKTDENLCVDTCKNILARMDLSQEGSVPVLHIPDPDIDCGLNHDKTLDILGDFDSSIKNFNISENTLKQLRNDLNTSDISDKDSVKSVKKVIVNSINSTNVLPSNTSSGVSKRRRPRCIMIMND